MILSGRCAPATVSHDAAAPPRTQRDCRLLMPAPSLYVIVTARMSALVGLGGRTSASAECRQWSGRAVRWSSLAILLSAKARRRKVTPGSPLAQKENPGAAAVARIAQRRHRSASMGLFTDQLTDQ
jgi:hypothetical protein